MTSRPRTCFACPSFSPAKRHKLRKWCERETARTYSAPPMSCRRRSRKSASSPAYASFIATAGCTAIFARRLRLEEGLRRISRQGKRALVFCHGPVPFRDLAGPDVVSVTSAAPGGNAASHLLFRKSRTGLRDSASSARRPAGWYRYESGQTVSVDPDPVVEDSDHKCSEGSRHQRRASRTRKSSSAASTRLSTKGRDSREGIALRATTSTSFTSTAMVSALPRGPMFYSATVGASTGVATVKQFRATHGASETRCRF